MGIPVTWVLVVTALAAPFLAYAWGAVATKYEVRAVERAACTKRIDAFAAEINAKANARVELAEAAANAVLETPAVPEAIAKLCKSDPACRERGTR